MPSNFKKETIRNEKHRKFIATLPCCVSGISGSTQAAHIRAAGSGGLGFKNGDCNCIPLSWMEHHKQHNKHERGFGEKSYWGDDLPRAIRLAELLYENTGNTDKCLNIIQKFRFKIHI